MSARLTVSRPAPVEYQPQLASRPRRWFANGLAAAGLSTALAAAAIPGYLLWDFSHVPAGTVMRPMGLTAMLLLCAAAALVVALPLSVVGLVLAWRAKSGRLLAVLGILSSFLAVLGGFPLFNWIVASRGFILAE